MWYNIWEFLVHYSVKEGSDFILLKIESEKKNFIGQAHTLAITQFSLCLKCLGYLSVVLCIYVVYTSRKEIQLSFFSQSL